MIGLQAAHIHYFIILPHEPVLDFKVILSFCFLISACAGATPFPKQSQKQSVSFLCENGSKEACDLLRRVPSVNASTLVEIK